VVVEGVGGFLVPLGPDWTAADLAADLGFPVLLVVGLRLGCLNHALLTRAAIRAAGLPFAGWIGSSIDPEFARASDNLATLTEWLGQAPLAVLPHAPDAAPDRVAAALADAASGL
jgi:dethiobiotin synthetase